MIYDNSWVTIDLDAIEFNIQEIQRKVNSPVMAVIKSDAYGHGAAVLAKHLENICAYFGVSSLSEALELRKIGIQTPILVLGPIHPDGFSLAVKQDICLTIFRLTDAQALSETAMRMRKCARVHLALDTGMCRIGFQPSMKSVQDCTEIAKLPNLVVEGIFSHFATADSEDLRRTKEQQAIFDDFCNCLRERGLNIPIRHLHNSAGIMNFSEHYDMVRSGIVMYGLYPSKEVSPSLLQLKPALSWHSRVTHVQSLPAGKEIGYGGCYVTTKDTVVATICVGYGDGYRRSLSNTFYVLIHGKPAKILGRICMDQMMVDVSGIPDVAIGDVVTLIGKDRNAEITTDEIAEAAGSFSYEFLCGIARRVPRYYTQNKKVVQIIHYILDEQEI